MLALLPLLLLAAAPAGCNDPAPIAASPAAINVGDVVGDPIVVHGVLHPDALPVYLTAAQAQKIYASGARTIRIGLRLPKDETKWTPGVIAAYQTAIRNATDAGLTPEIVAGNSLLPDANKADWSTPEYRAKWVSAVITLMKAFPTARQWEIWNEPAGGQYGITTDAWAWMIRLVYERMHQQQIPDWVISGGLFASNDHDGAGAKNAIRALFQSQAFTDYAAGHHQYPLDFVGWHPYFDAGSPLDPTKLAQRFDDFYASYAPFYTAHGLTPPRTRVTEAGHDGLLVDEATQAAAVTTLYDVLGHDPRVKDVFLFKWQETASEVTRAKQPESYGLVGAKGRLKPAFDAYVAAARSVACPAGTVAGDADLTRAADAAASAAAAARAATWLGR